MWQHIKLSEQIRPWDTLACCWDVKQSTSKQTWEKSRTWKTGIEPKSAAVEANEAVPEAVCGREETLAVLNDKRLFLFLGCFKSQQQADRLSKTNQLRQLHVPPHWDRFADQITCYLIHSQYTDTRQTSPSTDTAIQVSGWVATSTQFKEFSLAANFTRATRR